MRLKSGIMHNRNSEKSGMVLSALETGVAITWLVLPATAMSSIDDSKSKAPACAASHTTSSTQAIAPPSRALLPADVQAGAVYIEADDALFREAGQSLLDGDVIIASDETILRADRAAYDKNTQDVSATGNVYLISAGLELQSEALNLSLIHI